MANMPLVRTALERARFATSSRLVTCLINEHLVRANADSPYTVVIHSLDDDGDMDYKLFLSLVHPVPVGSVHSLDPTDIVPFHILDINSKELLCPVEIAEHFCKEWPVDLKQQLASSVQNQEWVFNHLPTKIPSLFSSAIEWEHYIIEGHPTHPMHRSRTPFNGFESVLEAPNIKFVSIPRSELVIHGDWETIMKDYLPPAPSPDILILPVHELQVPNVLSRIQSATLIPNFERRSVAQVSVRTVSPLPASDLPGFHLKLALTICTTSAWRTLSCYCVYNAPRITTLAKFIAPECLVVLGEVASIGSNSTDETVSKHIACIVREDSEVLMPNESIVVAHSLVEKTPDDGVPLVRVIFNLDTEQKCIDFLKRYSELACAAFLPPMLKHGFCFESHGQNTLARFDRHTGQLVGFAIRDFGGIRIHRKQFEKTTPFQLDILPGSCIVTDDITEVYTKGFHCLIQSQMNRLVRALDLHYSRKGWTVVRKAVEKYISADSPAGKVWFKETVPLKSFIRMKLADKYRDYIYSETPNVLALADKDE
jgi:siderophore synthetase component